MNLISRFPPRRRFPTDESAGTTLVELMIAVSILGIVSIGMVGAFATVTKSIQFSKSRTLASTLAQEQMQIMKQKAFNKVLVTTSTVYLTEFSPNIPYDSGYYPPENIVEGGIEYNRYTYVQVAQENSGTLQYLGAVPDTGMKALLVTVTWNQGSEKKKVQLRNIISNIDTTMTNAIFSGKVQIYPTSVGIPNARVTMAENVGYSDTTDSSGDYSINLSPGSYSIVAWADGYFPKYQYASIGANSSQTLDFSLIAMGSGTIQGTAWFNDHLVISQIVGSTQNAGGFCQEYVEVFNPTTWTWLINGNIQLGYMYFNDPGPTFVNMNHVVDSVGPGAYYLFANTTTITAGGVTKQADAVYDPGNANYPDLIHVAGVDSCGGGGGNADLLGIAWVSNGEPIDLVGWSQNPRQPDEYETAPINQNTGLESEEQYVRRSSTGGITSGWGRAYDSNNNDVDFVVSSSILYPPHNSFDTETVVSGTPAYGAYVSATDGLSGVVTASSVGSPPVAEFILTTVATGTWSVIISSGSYLLEVSSVVVTENSVTSIPNSVTTPTWPANGRYASILYEATTGGYISGWVKDALGSPISPSITVKASGNSAQANTSNGTYLLSMTTGTYVVEANPNNSNGSYISISSQNVQVQLGRVSSDVNFVLSQGGRIRGFVTRDGINALPGVAVAAYNSNDVVMDQEVSGSDGYFTLVNLSTGDYTVEPVLGSGEASSPSTDSVTVTAGNTVSVTTFTVTGAFGSVRGSVTISGEPIRTGVLVICSTMSMSSGPPTLSVTTLNSAAIYIANSYEDGTYAMDVRGSTAATYNLYAYYSTFTGNNPVISTRTASNITVTAGQTTSGVNFAW